MTASSELVGVLDTSVFIARESGRRLRVDALPQQLYVTVVTTAELRVGVLAAADDATRAARLETFVTAAALEPLPVDEAASERWAQIRVSLARAGRRMPVNDAWIAAIALSRGLPVVTQDDDYDVLAEHVGLVVVKV